MLLYKNATTAANKEQKSKKSLQNTHESVTKKQTKCGLAVTHSSATQKAEQGQ